MGNSVAQGLFGAIVQLQPLHRGMTPYFQKRILSTDVTQSMHTPSPNPTASGVAITHPELPQIFVITKLKMLQAATCPAFFQIGTL